MHKILFLFILLVPFVSQAEPFYKERVIGVTVFFDTNSSVISKQDLKGISDLNVVNVIRVEGFADERDTTLYNRLLSERRANSLASAFGEQSLSAQIFSFGESMPKTSNCGGNVKCLQPDRRANAVVKIRAFSPIFEKGKPVPGELHSDRYFTYPLGFSAD